MAVTFQKATLPNGLTIIAETDPAAHTAACGFFVKTGARDEQRPRMGVSHFLEHMMFKGTERRSAEDVNRQFDEIGANYNAFTTSEMTAFHAHVLPERLPEALDILADILRPSLRPADFDTEKGVILEEIAMYKDQPFWVLYEHALERFFGEHPLGYRVLGTEDTIRALERDQMDAYFRERYSADNTVLSLAGRLDFDHAVRLAEKLCGSWQRTGAARDAAPPAAAAGEFTLHDEKVTRAYMLALSPAPAMSDPRRYAAMMLAQVLGSSDNSRLHWALVEPGVAEEAQAGYEPHDGSGMFYLYASGDPERAAEIWALVEREVAGLVPSLTEADLERLRNKLATAVTLAGERPSGRMHRLGRLWPYLGSYLSLEDELAAINAVTLADLRAVAAAYPFQPRMFGRMLPKA
ncbi:MAG: pitrilysin family protein [Planctomycetota bacterium]|nr:pitrilysin family protein [Planctomycetota bacterium]